MLCNTVIQCCVVVCSNGEGASHGLDVCSGGGGERGAEGSLTWTTLWSKPAKTTACMDPSSGASAMVN